MPNVQFRSRRHNKRNFEINYRRSFSHTIFGKGCAIWIIDLLDRFGGVISYGEHTCCVERNEIKKPVFIIDKIGSEQFEAINELFNEYEFYIKNKIWKIIAKQMPEYGIVMLFIINRPNKNAIYQGVLDENTFLAIKERLVDGRQAWNDIFQLGI